MRDQAPFRAEDLAEVDERLLSVARRVVRLKTVALSGEHSPDVIGLRHDCDNAGSLATAVELARWEYERGYRATYYILHTSPYWRDAEFPHMLEAIADYGHEIGIHANALAESLRTGEDPDLILDLAIARLRGLGHEIVGVAGHGDATCNRERTPDESAFVNDEQFIECRRPKEGQADRLLARGRVSWRLAPRPLADFGLEYEALLSGLPFPFRISDSGGRWGGASGFDDAVATFAKQAKVSAPPLRDDSPRQLHLLLHPDWWASAFPSLAAAA